MRLHLDLPMLKETGARFSSDKVPRLAAALAYTAIFSIAPLFIIIIAVAGALIGVTNGGHGHHVVEGKLLDAVRASAGSGAADAVRAMISAAFDKPRQSIIAQIIGWVVFIFGAIGLVAALEDALNTVWHVEPERKGILAMVRDKALSLAMVIGIGLLLIVTTVVNAVVAFVSGHLQQLLPFPGAGLVFGGVNILVSVAVITVLFALIYKFLPAASIDWNDVWTGALVTSVLFVAGQAIIGLYLGRAGVSSGYGAAGSLVILLLWVYYSAMVLLAGAEFTTVFAEHHGSRKDAAARTAPTVRGDLAAFTNASSRRPLPGAFETTARTAESSGTDR